MWKWMDLLLRKNHLLRCWGWLSLLNWIGALTLSLLINLPPRKLQPWFVLWSFFLLRLLCINIAYDHVWNTVVMLGLHSWNSPLPPFIKGRLQDLSKIESLGGGTKTFAKKGRITPKRVGRVGGCHFFITLHFNYSYCMCVGKVKFPLLSFSSSVFWVNHARFSSRSLLQCNNVSFVHF